ncbi:hypothetical protein DACRYDRAFT_30411, partial [Dacryopinax primogenitus]
KAFRFDGHLRHYPEQLRICLLPDAQPISVPMYRASPTKQEVIDKQLQAWSKQGMIEVSISPWAFLVVIVYCNGKVHF